MVVLLPGDVGDRLPGIGVDDHRVGAPRNVESVILGVQGDVVHAAVAANVKCVFDRPGTLRGSAEAKREQYEPDQKASKYISTAHEILQ